MNQKFYAVGKWVHRSVLNKELAAQITQMKESSYLSKTAQDDQIKKLRSAYWKKTNDLSWNHY